MAEPRSRADRASTTETLGVLLDVVLPTFARGVIVRRPLVERLLGRLDIWSWPPCIA